MCLHIFTQKLAKIVTSSQAEYEEYVTYDILYGTFVVHT